MIEYFFKKYNVFILNLKQTYITAVFIMYLDFVILN